MHVESRKIIQMNLFTRQEQRCRHREKTCGCSGGRKEQDKLEDYDRHIYTTVCKTDSPWKPAINHRELSLVLCDDLEGWGWWGGGEGSPRERGYTYAYG